MTPIYYSRPAPWRTPSNIHKDLTGLVFDRLEVLGFSHVAFTPSNKAIYLWLCRCECGNYCPVERGNLKSGNSKSCGCYSQECRIENNITHGMSKSREYKAWQRMKERCYNKKKERYPRYGGRGIYVHEAWKNNFPKFLEYMGPMPKDMNSIERLENDKSYIPGNVIWANDVIQQNNTSRSRRLKNGKTIAQNARDIGLSYGALHRRIHLGWCETCALTLPARGWAKGCPHIKN